MFAVGQLGNVALQATPDTLNYVTYAHRVLGESEAEATRAAGRYYCLSPAHHAVSRHRVGQTTFAGSAAGAGTAAMRSCEAGVARQLAHSHSFEKAVVWPSATVRYQRIFSSRPGYPVLLAPFIALLGDVKGIWLFSVVVTAAAGAVVALGLRAVGAGPVAALAGQALYYALPIEVTSTRPMSEGVGMLALAVVLFGCLRFAGGRRRSGLAVVTAASAACFAIRYSMAQEALLALALVLWATVRASGGPRGAGAGRRPSGLSGLTGLTGLAVAVSGLAAVSMAASAVMGWPGLRDSVQDTLTMHYRTPDLPDPWPLFMRLELNFWWEWLKRQVAAPFLLPCLAVAVWGVLRSRGRARLLGLLAGAVALTGLVNEAAHPLMAIGPRIMITVWFLPVYGIPLALEAYARRARAAGPDRRDDDGPRQAALPQPQKVSQSYV
ncbi:hypothetical protein [Streptomyces beihaiensis]|uniref:Glycosyltransferase RgtA/B/C/D-like domain-containing protein n=1 Tax=Streptomyces beihaiensis TaxID=2984495 RepID=A0ABT3TZ39_9ACTN|nr:hypothetical protein [Streptomyces beihaiensis]MCX3062317.1 hypothetical protein [Streptomyces beihaiensis]